MNDPLPTCVDFELQLSLLAADCLPDEETVAVEAHLRDCSICQEKWRQLTGLCAELAEARPTIPKFDGERLISGVKAEIAVTPAKKSQPTVWLLIAGAAFAASLVAVLTLRTMFLVSPQEPQQVERPEGPVDPPEEEKRPLPTVVVSQPPTWIDYQRALADSEEAVDNLLDRESQRLTFLSLDQSPNRLQEFLP